MEGKGTASPDKRPLTNRCTVAEATDVVGNVPLESAPLERCNGCHGLVFTPTPGGEASSSLTAAEWDRSRASSGIAQHAAADHPMHRGGGHGRGLQRATEVCSIRAL